MTAATLTVQEPPGEMLRRARAQKAKRDFGYFVRLLRPEFEIEWFHDVIMSELVRAGTAFEDTKLGVAIPPGHGKTEYAWLYTAWMVTRDPDIQIKYVTYSITFARDQFKRLKNLLNSDTYVHYFGRKINTKRVVSDERESYVNSAELFEIVGGTGWVHATGFGGQITGSRCDLIIIDDPFKRDEVHSKIVRNRKWGIYLDEISTRARPYRPLRILMIFTRWHQDDLAGRAKNLEADDWRWVEIEALRMESLDSQRQADFVDPRAEGEALWPAVTTADKIRKVREIAEGTFWSIYQQVPQPPGGSLFKAAWFDRWETIDVRPGRFFQSWDFRHGGPKDSGSYVVGLLFWQYDSEPDTLYIVSARRARWKPDESAQQFVATQQRPLWSKAEVILVENKGDGVMILSMSRGRYPVQAVSPSGSKVSRARVVVPYVARGSCLLPIAEIAGDDPWIDAFIGEVTLFSDLGSGTGNDDFVDAMTQALDWAFDASASEPDGADIAQQTWDLLMGKGND